MLNGTGDVLRAQPLTGLTCTKRDGRAVRFDANKIRAALAKCFAAIGMTDADKMVTVDKVTAGAVRSIQAANLAAPTVEQIQQQVIRQLWVKSLFTAAEHYQNYRENHRKQRELETATLFGEREEFKPFDYPDATRFKEAIHENFWTWKDFDPISDVQDYKAEMSSVEQAAFARTLLAISQIEVKIKKFWGRLGDRLQRAEFDQVGGTFGDNEVRHQDAYSRALDVLGLNGMFKTVKGVPAIRHRIDYLNRAMQAGIHGSDRGYARVLATFSLLVENVSLFSQFVIVRSMYHHRGLCKNTDNIVQATQKEEAVHALFGAWLCNLIKAERPEWFGPAFQDDLRATCLEAYQAEQEILDWIFSDGQISTVSRPLLDAFLKDRVNQGVVLVGCDPIFEKVGDLSELEWFTSELKVPVQVDNFWKTSPHYSRNNADISAESMW